MRPPDTSPDALAVQVDAYRRMGGEGRVAMLAAMSDEVREIALAGIRSRHPTYSESEVHDALHRLLLGDELFRAVWPGRPLLRP